MFLVKDVRETRVYQEAKEEGRKESITFAIAKMAANKMSAAEIASILELDAELVRKALANLVRT
jgi:predicted transposase YdaD